MAVLGIATNVLGLYVPKIGAVAIDAFTKNPTNAGMGAGAGTGALSNVPANVFANVFDGTLSQSIWLLIYLAVGSLLIGLAQIYFSNYFSEKVAYDLREKLTDKISEQTFGYVSASTPGRLLTVMTSDVDAVKNVIAQGFVTLLGAVVTLLGAAGLLIQINLRLALYTISVIPFLVLAMALIFGSLTRLFRESQENVERINALVNESIIASALVRVLNAGRYEINKFLSVSARSRDIGLGIVRHISALIPTIMFLANLTTIIIVWFGGIRVIDGTLTIGNFSAFLSYSAMFIWPLFVLSFVGTMISRGGVSLKRVNEVLDEPVVSDTGTFDGKVKGDIEFRNVSISYPAHTGKTILKDISFKIKAGSHVAVVGPTASGKTQLLYLMAGLIHPDSGEILLDGRPLHDYSRNAIFSQIGLVFQDSIMFNSSLRDNVYLKDSKKPATSQSSDTTYSQKALKVAELDDLVQSLPQGLDTLVSERGTSLSGGQKQRVMLARALAVEPTILLLDDFTARVDKATEEKIRKNIFTQYPNITLVSITEKITPVIGFEQIIVLMEGELIATGRHEELLERSFEYKQIFSSEQTV